MKFTSEQVRAWMDRNNLEMHHEPEMRVAMEDAATLISEREPSPAESESIPWDRVPRAVFAAKDSDGETHLFNVEPFIKDGCWIGSDNGAPFGRWARYSFMGPSEIHIPGDWRASLRKRPDGI